MFEEHRERTALELFALVLIVLVVGLYAGYSLGNHSVQQEQDPVLAARVTDLESQLAGLQSQVTTLETVGANTTVYLPAGYNALYESVKDSIVTIEGLEAETSTGLFGTSTTYTEVLGSGFVVNLTGTPLVVTNFHVVDGMINGSITFIDGEAYPFAVLGTDKYSDLAVLKPIGVLANELKPLTVVSSQTLTVGATVVAIGNPYGLQSTLTSGVVSQLNRAIQTDTAGNYLIAGVIQISTPINPGNSGGPLFDAEGRVVGVTAAIISGSENVGFAISSDAVLREFDALVINGTYEHPYLGISGISLDYLTAQAAGLNITYGALIETVASGSPAAQAGLRGGTSTVSVAGQDVTAGGDVIIQANGQPIRTMDDLTSYLEANDTPGMTVNLTVIRDGATLVIPVVLGIRS
jgi:S1-C subfamily serine protease